MSLRLHVAPHGRAWAVLPEGARTFISLHRTKEAAIAAARTTAQREHFEVVIGDPQSGVQTLDSCQNNPLSAIDSTITS